MYCRRQCNKSWIARTELDRIESTRRKSPPWQQSQTLYDPQPRIPELADPGTAVKEQYITRLTGVSPNYPGNNEQKGQGHTQYRWTPLGTGAHTVQVDTFGDRGTHRTGGHLYRQGHTGTPYSRHFFGRLRKSEVPDPTSAKICRLRLQGKQGGSRH